VDDYPLYMVSSEILEVADLSPRKRGNVLSKIIVPEDDHHFRVVCAKGFGHVGRDGFDVGMATACFVDLGLIPVLPSPRAVDNFELDD
jgi:hypothetical protein